MTRIVLIHATPVAMPPVAEAFARGWPEAETMNLLDDGLAPDLQRAGKIDAAITRRIGRLAEHAIAADADGILYTCSAFGTAIEAARRDTTIPVLKPNEAMFAAALEVGRRVGMLATFAPSVPSMAEEFAAMAAELDRDATLQSVCVPEALQALHAGDGATHDRLLAEAGAQLADCDVVVLAQFSTARARDAVAAVVSCPVLTSPDSAVATLRNACA